MKFSGGAKSYQVWIGIFYHPCDPCLVSKVPQVKKSFIPY